jgi:hypothetical protein
MWTSKNRGRYDRSALRYPSDLTDDEWAFIEPLIPPARRGGNKRCKPFRRQRLIKLVASADVARFLPMEQTLRPGTITGRSLIISS